MQRYFGRAAAAACLLVELAIAIPALAQKQGGVLKVYHRDSPASMSILEEATISIVPDLATTWEFSEDGTQLKFKLRDGVKWHDGKPFTAKDVACTWGLLLGKATDKLRTNPR